MTALYMYDQMKFLISIHHKHVNKLNNYYKILRVRIPCMYIFTDTLNKHHTPTWLLKYKLYIKHFYIALILSNSGTIFLVAIKSKFDCPVSHFNTLILVFKTE